MAASFRSQQDVEEAMQAGVKHMTIKFDLLQELLENEYTLQAMQDFNENGCGIGYD
jgi:transaldolase